VRFGELLDRVEPLLSELSGEERLQTERVVEICRQLQRRERSEKAPSPAQGDPELKRELGRLVELLSRRSAKAIPLAKLGRAALADLAADPRSVSTILIECDAQLSDRGHGDEVLDAIGHEEPVREVNLKRGHDHGRADSECRESREQPEG
jgi:hypothetical protein